MGREIKFRFWTGTQMESWDHAKAWSGLGHYLEHHNEYIPMQYTGLKDKNGKEIYELDIIHYNRGYVDDSINDFKQGLNYVIVFRQGSFYPYNENKKYQLGLSSAKDGIIPNYEVIGNIYEHPDLIK